MSLTRQLPELYLPNQLAYLAFEEKIELELRNTIAWQLQKKMDDLCQCGILEGNYMVRVEWSPGGRSKCDMAVLRLDETTDNKADVIALFEFKDHSTQAPEQKYKTKMQDDVKKMKDFLTDGESADLYYIFFNHVHLHQVEKYKLGTPYLSDIDRALRKDFPINKDHVEESMTNYCQGLSEDPDMYMEHSFVDLGTYFDHNIWLYTAVYLNKNFSK